MPNGETIGVLIKALAPTVAEKILGVIKDYSKVKEKDIILLVLAITAEQNAKAEIHLEDTYRALVKLSENIEKIGDCVTKVDEGMDILLNRTENLKSRK